MTFATEAEAQAFLKRNRDLAVIAIPTTHGYWAITSLDEVLQPPKICSICGEPFREFSNNAIPINDGRCCAYCDDHVVTPERIRRARS